MGGGRGAKTVKRPPQQPAQSSIRELLGATDAQTAHPATFSAAPAHQTTGLCERGNDTRRSTGRSGRQNAAARRNMQREERVTVQGPVKKQQPDGMSWGQHARCKAAPLLCGQTRTLRVSAAGTPHRQHHGHNYLPCTAPLMGDARRFETRWPRAPRFAVYDPLLLRVGTGRRPLSTLVDAC